jgi:hypothetical protein
MPAATQPFTRRPSLAKKQNASPSGATPRMANTMVSRQDIVHSSPRNAET